MRFTSEHAQSFAKFVAESTLKSNPVAFLNHALEQLSAKGGYANWLEEQAKRGLKPVGDAAIYKEPSTVEMINLNLPGDIASAFVHGFRNTYYWGFAITDLIAARSVPVVGEFFYEALTIAEQELEKLSDLTKLPIPKIEVEKTLVTVGDWIGVAVLAENLKEEFYKEALAKYFLGLRNPDALTAVKYLAISGAFSGEAKKINAKNFERISVTPEATSTKVPPELEGIIDFANKLGLDHNSEPSVRYPSGEKTSGATVQTGPGQIPK